MDWQRILRLIPSIRRPLALTGLVVVVLYGVYRLILTLPIFSQIDDVQTFVLVDRIALYLFILALVAIVLSIFAYFGVRLLTQRSIQSEETAESAPQNGLSPGQIVPAQLPELSLKLFLMDRAQSHRDELDFVQTGKSVPWSRVFGLALENTAKSTSAKGISIRLSLEWGGGDTLQKAPTFQAPPRVKGWETKKPQLFNEAPAVLTFNGPDLICFHGQPHEWTGFKLTLHEQWRGFFWLRYKVSSLEPYTERSEKFKITIGG